MGKFSKRHIGPNEAETSAMLAKIGVNSVAELVFAHLFNAVRFVYDSNRNMPNVGNTKFDDLKKNY